MTHGLFSICLKSLVFPQVGDKTRSGLVTLFFLLITINAGCSKQDNEATAIPRPVTVFRVGEQIVDASRRFAGEVLPRYQTTLAFRVAGKVLVRQVDIGERVRKGQLLAKLDATDYQLNCQALKAQIASAHAEVDFSKDERQRHRELFGQQLISLAELDRHQTAYITVRERLKTLEAQLGQASNQLAYTELHADRDGVVTGLQVESGQVVAAGQPLVKLAQLKEKEVLIQIPEHHIDEVHIGQHVDILLWADANRRYKGRIREISEAVDAASRSYDLKVAFMDAPNSAHLGMTATVELQLNPKNQIVIPFSAVFASGNEPKLTKVWQVDENRQTVNSLAVQLGEPALNETIVVSGLTQGQLIVSAGAHRLQEGQSITILKKDQPDVQTTAASRLAQP